MLHNLKELFSSRYPKEQGRHNNRLHGPTSQPGPAGCYGRPAGIQCSLLAVLLAVSPVLPAQDSFLTSRQHETDQYQWRQIDADMSPGKYREALRHNRRLARDSLKHSIVSLGVPKMGANLMGAAIALTVDDLKLHLNKSKTLELQIEDATDEDRSALIQIKIDW